MSIFYLSIRVECSNLWITTPRTCIVAYEFARQAPVPPTALLVAKEENLMSQFSKRSFKALTPTKSIPGHF